jgi:hypothetical protein
MTDEPKFDRIALERYLSGHDAEKQSPAPPDPKRLTVPSMLALLGGNAADAGSTIYALRNGAREMNPVYGESPHPGKVVGIKAASTLAELLLLRKLAEHKPKLANGLAKGIGAAMGGIAIHNVRQAGKD